MSDDDSTFSFGVTPADPDTTPVWDRCPCCDDYICHYCGPHAADCDCPEVDWWLEHGKAMPYDIPINTAKPLLNAWFAHCFLVEKHGADAIKAFSYDA